MDMFNEQREVQKRVKKVYSTRGVVGTNFQGTLDFLDQSSSTEYIDLANSYISMSVDFTTLAALNFASTDQTLATNMGVCSNIASQLFNNCFS